MPGHAAGDANSEAGFLIAAGSEHFGLAVQLDLKAPNRKKGAGAADYAKLWDERLKAQLSALKEMLS